MISLWRRWDQNVFQCSDSQESERLNARIVALPYRVPVRQTVLAFLFPSPLLSHAPLDSLMHPTESNGPPLLKSRMPAGPDLGWSDAGEKASYVPFQPYLWDERSIKHKPKWFLELSFLRTHSAQRTDWFQGRRIN